MSWLAKIPKWVFIVLGALVAGSLIALLIFSSTRSDTSDSQNGDDKESSKEAKNASLDEKCATEVHYYAKDAKTGSNDFGPELKGKNAREKLDDLQSRYCKDPALVVADAQHFAEKYPKSGLDEFKNLDEQRRLAKTNELLKNRKLWRETVQKLMDIQNDSNTKVELVTLEGHYKTMEMIPQSDGKPPLIRVVNVTATAESLKFTMADGTVLYLQTTCGGQPREQLKTPASPQKLQGPESPVQKVVNHPKPPKKIPPPDCKDSGNCPPPPCVDKPNAPCEPEEPPCEDTPEKPCEEEPPCEEGPNPDECNPPEECPEGTTGTPPNCEVPECPEGTTGTYPNCETPECPEGTTGTPPNCEPPSCPEGSTGEYPDCNPPEECPNPQGNPPAEHGYEWDSSICDWKKIDQSEDCQQNGGPNCPENPSHQPQDPPSGPTDGAQNPDNTPNPVNNGPGNQPAPDDTEGGSYTGPQDDNSSSPDSSTTEPDGSNTTAPPPSNDAEDGGEGGDNNAGMPPVPESKQQTMSAPAPVTKQVATPVQKTVQDQQTAPAPVAKQSGADPAPVQHTPAPAPVQHDTPVETPSAPADTVPASIGATVDSGVTNG